MSLFSVLWLTLIGLPSVAALIVCIIIKVSRRGMTPEELESEDLDQLDALRPPRNVLEC